MLRATHPLDFAKWVLHTNAATRAMRPPVGTQRVDNAIQAAIMVKMTPEKADAITRCLLLLEEKPDTPIATAAREFGVTRAIIRRRLKGVTSRVGERAHNTKLNAAEEKGILRVIKRLDDLNLSISKNWITTAANNVLDAKKNSSTSIAPTVGPRWVDNFILRNGLMISIGKIRDSKRQIAEQTPTIKNHLNLLQQAIQSYGITPDCIWNMDETGFQSGTARSTVIVTFRKHKSSQMAIPINKEYVTSIEAITAAGDFIEVPVSYRRW